MSKLSFSAQKTEHESTSELSDQEENDRKCAVRNRLWRSYKGKKSDEWVICDFCDEYYCPKCIPPDADLSDDFYIPKCVDE